MLHETIANSVVKTIVDGRWLSEKNQGQILRQALAYGYNAAQLGRAIPLYILLDVLVRRQRPGAIARPGAHDEWLTQFCKEYHNRLEPGGACLYGIMAGWPRSDDDHQCVEWAGAYLHLSHNSHLHSSILSKWLEPVKGTSSPITGIQPNKAAPAWFWDAFASTNPTDIPLSQNPLSPALIPEAFDHTAARIYTETAEPDLSLLRQRIKKLINRQRTPNMLPGSGYTEQDKIGAITPATLAWGKYGKLLIINHGDIRLNDPPVSPPRQILHVHLCWHNTLTGVGKKISLPLFSQPGEAQKHTASEASTLNAIAALIMDDWRSILQGIPVQFYAHKNYLNENRQTCKIGPGGRRWQSDFKNGGLLPPPKILTCFFERPQWLPADSAIKSDAPQLRWGEHWRCLCLLESELPELGFKPTPTNTNFPSGWEVDRQTVAGVNTIVVLDPGNNKYQIYNIRPWMSDQVQLIPIPLKIFCSDKDNAFLSRLRRQLAEIVVRVMERIYR